MAAPRPFNEIPYVTLPDDYQHRLGSLLADAYQEHGPIFRTTFLNSDVVYLVGPEANRFVLSSQRLLFSHHEGWGKFGRIVDAFGNGVLTMDGEEHAAHRRIMNPAFTMQYMDRYLPIMNRIVRQRLDSWSGRDSIDIYEEGRVITFSVVAEALAGLSSADEIQRFGQLFAALGKLARFADDPDEFQRGVAPLREQQQALMQTRIDELRACPADDALGLLIQARDGDGCPLTEDQLLGHVNILLVAGYETTTSLVAWLAYLLSEHPAFTERLIEEQRQVLGPESDPTLEDLKRMTLLDCAMNEALRLFSPVSTGARGAAEDLVFHGYHVPAGTKVCYSIAATHLLPELWTEPLRFDPERFAPPREEHKRVPYSFVGFGGGPRICIGANFAQVETKLLFSHLLRRYRLALLPDQEIVRFSRLTCIPLHGVKLQVAESQVLA
jgi:retinoid hydroxylase